MKLKQIDIAPMNLLDAFATPDQPLRVPGEAAAVAVRDDVIGAVVWLRDGAREVLARLRYGSYGGALVPVAELAQSIQADPDWSTLRYYGDQSGFMDLKEFRDKGYLLMVNREFLHRVGLAFSIRTDDAGNVTLAGIEDHRDEPGGYAFAHAADAAAAARRRDQVAFVNQELARRASARIDMLGNVVQPLDDLVTVRAA